MSAPVTQRIHAVAGVRTAPAVRRAVAFAASTLTLATLTWVGAHIVIPLQPVPITMQTLFVLLAGALGTRARGVTSQALYVAAGALGLPVFAGGAAGWAVLAGPTGGYLVGFALAPLVVATLLDRRESVAWQAGVFTLATLVIFALGVAHLALFHTGGRLGAALAVGFVPFVPGAIFKIVAATSIARSWRALRGRR